MRFYAPVPLGPKRNLTPEGFLLCQDVVLARTGEMIYGPDETGISPGLDGLCHVSREADEVFRPEAIASFNGKPLVDAPGHPPEDVNPTNWKQYTVGVVLDPRRGSGAEEDVMLGDVVIFDQGGIDAIQSGKREVSCGYDADYEQMAPGRGRQLNIIGNHVALVDTGRCGHRCAIGDNLTVEETPMTVMERLRAALGKGDCKAATAVLDEFHQEDGKDNNHSPVIVNVGASSSTPTKDGKTEDCADKVMDAAIADRFKQQDVKIDSISKDVKDIKDALTSKDEDEDDRDDDDEDDKRKSEDEAIAGTLEMEAPEGTTHDAIRKARDSAFLVDSYQDTISFAEIITPGVRIPTFDSKSVPRKGLEVITRFRKGVLEVAYNTQSDTRTFMDGVLNGRKLTTYDDNGIRTLFRAVGLFKKSSNNHDNVSAPPAVGQGVQGGVRTAADLNRRNAERYAVK